MIDHFSLLLAFNLKRTILNPYSSTSAKEGEYGHCPALQRNSFEAIEGKSSQDETIRWPQGRKRP